MPRYVYQAKIRPDQIIRSDIAAESEQDALNKLARMGYFPISLEPEILSLDNKGSSLFKKVSNKDLVLFTRQLASLIDSGVHITNSLDILAKQATNQYFKAVLDDITSRIKDGASLKESFSAHPHLFSQLYSAMLQSGEESGRLNETLKRLAVFLEKEEEFKDALRAALTYPLFVCAIGMITIIVLLIFVIPRLVVMFEDMGQALPLPTLILINVSHFFKSYIWLILALVFLAMFTLQRLYRSPKVRLSFDKYKLKVAIFGAIILKTQVSRLMRTLSLLISSGVPITAALETSISILHNQALKTEVEKFKEQIRGGLSLSFSISASKFFPGFVSNMIVVGEETGSLDKALVRIADDYEHEAERSLKILTRLLEPIIILVLGLVVGFIVLAMLLPIFQINLIIK